MTGPSSINKSYADASHPPGSDGVPNKAVSKPSTDKHEELRELHRDKNHSEQAIANRSSSGIGGRGSAQNYGQTNSSIEASHGCGGKGSHPEKAAAPAGAKYTDGSTSMADQPEPPASPGLASIDSQRMV
ncbi:hypothetical protein BCV69DRAFT_280809 [Microstroma glucosiphilum]|uniref:Uncharacterized protein n=1 Tax=Pseudomicrostroma glucosiphilum TaxID=1684307 RepID=A0A316UE68_9BASI|nr:hypothetical protein BCV69DRAFT_280809 [Pseudomicrostroma glucosiphilum]PWN23198.1 hypothetical protein BCV69DRAFT_280809 [Pseudomicrostroma glucosiphilum]